MRRKTQRKQSRRRRRSSRGGAAAARPQPQPQPQPQPPTTTASLEVRFGTALAAPLSRNAPLLSKEAATPVPEVEWSQQSFTPTSQPSLYTLICYDPDAPKPNAPYLHWLVINCTGPTPSSGTTVVPWAPPTPPPGTGIHRYIFTLFEQAAPLQPPAVSSRVAFPLAHFQKLHSLKKMDAKAVRSTSSETDHPDTTP